MLNLNTINKYTISGVEIKILTIIKRLVKFRKASIINTITKNPCAPRIAIVFHGRDFQLFINILKFLSNNASYIHFVTMKELSEIMENET